MKKAAIRIRTAAFTQIVNLYEPFCKDPEFCSGNVIYRTFTILRNSQGASTKNLFQLLTHALLDARNRRHIRNVAERNIIAVANSLSFIIKGMRAGIDLEHHDIGVPESAGHQVPSISLRPKTHRDALPETFSSDFHCRRR